eukprot:9049301-Alexandrium_andersonii.AAC.1
MRLVSRWPGSSSRVSLITANLEVRCSMSAYVVVGGRALKYVEVPRTTVYAGYNPECVERGGRFRNFDPGA